jgi:hypothetical protein
LHKEPQKKHVFLNTYWEYISTNKYGSVLDAQGAMPNVGAIFLSREESLILSESKQLSFGRQSQGKNSTK